MSNPGTLAEISDDLSNLDLPDTVDKVKAVINHLRILSEHDFARGNLDERSKGFIESVFDEWRKDDVIILDGLEGRIENFGGPAAVGTTPTEIEGFKKIPHKVAARIWLVTARACASDGMLKPRDLDLLMDELAIIKDPEIVGTTLSELGMLIPLTVLPPQDQIDCFDALSREGSVIRAQLPDLAKQRTDLRKPLIARFHGLAPDLFTPH